MNNQEEKTLREEYGEIKWHLREMVQITSDFIKGEITEEEREQRYEKVNKWFVNKLSENEERYNRLDTFIRMTILGLKANPYHSNVGDELSKMYDEFNLNQKDN